MTINKGPVKTNSRVSRALSLRIDKELGYFLAGFIFSVAVELVLGR